jgi:agmatine deiminase
VTRASSAPPVADTLRWPAEWEPHRATWLSWPHNAETWPGRLSRVQQVFAEMTRALQSFETVCINVVDDAMEDSVRRCLTQAGARLDASVEFHHVPTNDAWIRDHGPICVLRERPGSAQRLLLDFTFDAWGGKYPPWDRDDAVPARMAGILDLPRRRVETVLEGGSIDGNGRGSILTTSSCLLHPNRGVRRTRQDLEEVLADALGATNLLWLDGAIEGDDTDGHVDDLARFVGPSTVVAVRESDAEDPNAAALEENFTRLRRMRDERGAPLDVVALPMPPPVVEGGVRCPASYANFYLANGLALVPTFDVPEDARALAILGELLTGREVLGIPARDLVMGLGAVHCLTQQEPAAPTLPGVVSDAARP